METKANYVAVGTFVMLSVIALVVAVIWLAGGAYNKEYKYYQTYFTGAVTGLGEGTTVRFNGIEVGRVQNLEFDANDPRRVVVTLQVDATVPVHADSVASIESLGLTGGSYVEIAGGTRTAPLLTAQEGQRYPVIPTKPSTLQQLAESAPELMANLNVVSQRAVEVLNEENRKSLSETLANLAVATKQLNDTLVAATNVLATADRTFASADRTLGTAEKTVASIGSLSEHTDVVVQDSGAQVQQSLVQLRQLVTETRDMVASLTRLSNDLNREPTKPLFGDRYQGYTPR